MKTLIIIEDVKFINTSLCFYIDSYRQLQFGLHLSPGRGDEV